MPRVEGRLAAADLPVRDEHVEAGVPEERLRVRDDVRKDEVAEAGRHELDAIRHGVTLPPRDAAEAPEGASATPSSGLTRLAPAREPMPRLAQRFLWFRARWAFFIFFVALLTFAIFDAEAAAAAATDFVAEQPSMFGTSATFRSSAVVFTGL